MREAPRLFTLPEVSERLHKSTRWMQDFLRERPFGRKAGRTWLFTEDDIAAIIEALPCP
jgi:Helix-turn-helix domain